jgi:malic enzyme
MNKNLTLYKRMIEIAVIGAAAAGISMVLSVLFYNMRRSRCVKCQGCGCLIERENMSKDELANDELKMPVAL